MSKNNYNNGQGRQPQQNSQGQKTFDYKKWDKKTNDNGLKVSWNTELGNACMNDSESVELKPIFAAYLNLARQNLYDTLSQISKKARLQNSSDESNISQMNVIKCLNNKDTLIETKYYVMNQMLSQFPFIKIMAENEREVHISEKAPTADIVITPDKVYKIISNIAKVLNHKRNRHSHVELTGDSKDSSNEYLETEKTVAKYLLTTFKAAIRGTADRFSQKENESDESVKFRPKLNTRIFSDGIATKPIVKDGVVVKKSTENFDYLYAMRTKNSLVSPMGLALLICLLISKKDASIFFNALGKNFYGRAYTTSTENKTKADYPKADKAKVSDPKELIRLAAREIFSFYRIRLSKERIRSERSEYALALDMLNEVKKCPDELFQIISGEDQDKFRVPSKGYDNESVLLRRTDDRFPYFALRYIDDMNLFSFMRFHVNYGKYRYVFKEDKLCADGKVQPRVLQYELNGFGRINEIELRRVGAFEKLSESNGDSAEDSSKSKKTSKVSVEWDGTALIRESSIDEQLDKDSGTMEPYVTDCRTHYIINNNHVGINFFFTKKGKIQCNNFENEHNPDLRCYMPCITDYRIKNADETKNSDAAPQESKGITGVKQPMCRLSVFELPAMIFHSLLYKDQTVSAECDIDPKGFKISATEKVIFDYVSNYRKLFQGIADGSIHPTKGEISVDDKGRLNDDELLQLYGLHRKDIPEKILTYLSGCKKQRNKLKWDKILEKYGLVKIDIPEKLRNKLVSPNLSEFEEYAIIKIAKQFQSAQRKLESLQRQKDAIIVDKSKNNKDRIKNRIGKKSFKEIKAGQLATQLSKDIVSLQGKAIGDQNRPTGLNYRKMQAMIAQFGSTNGPTWNDLCKLFNNLGITGDDSLVKHPFLQEFLECEPKNTIELYEMYYAHKKDYLNKIEPNELYSLPFLHADQYRWKERNDEYYKELAKHYLDNTIDLPTGMFENSIKARLKDIAVNFPALNDALNKTRCNTAYLIAQYNNIVNCDASQPMYDYFRNYKFFDRQSIDYIPLEAIPPVFKNTQSLSFKNLLSEINSKCDSVRKEISLSSLRKISTRCIKTESRDQGIRLERCKIEQTNTDAKDLYLDKTIKTYIDKDNKQQNKIIKIVMDTTDEEKDEEFYKRVRLFNYLNDNERTLRRYQVQDILSFLMAKDILSTKLGNNENNFANFKLKDIMSTDKNILEEQVKFSVTLTFNDGKQLTVTQDDLKIKNFGDFYMVIKDSRIASLLPYIESVTVETNDSKYHTIVNREDLEYELDSYNIKRVEAIRNLQSIERKIINNKKPEILKETYTDTTDGKIKPVVNSFRELIEHYSNIDKNRHNLLIKIRNAFNHNRYTPADEVKINAQIGEIAKKIVHEISTNDSKQNQAKNKS